VTFSLGCDARQAIANAATTAGISGEFVRDVMVEILITRFGEVRELPHPAECLSDKGPGYIVARLAPLPSTLAWFPDYTLVHPHSALPYRSPEEFREDRQSSKSGLVS